MALLPKTDTNLKSRDGFLANSRFNPEDKNPGYPMAQRCCAPLLPSRKTHGPPFTLDLSPISDSVTWGSGLNGLLKEATLKEGLTGWP